METPLYKEKEESDKVEKGTLIQGDPTEEVSLRYESLTDQEQNTIRDEFIDYTMEMCEVPRYVAEETND